MYRYRLDCSPLEYLQEQATTLDPLLYAIVNLQQIFPYNCFNKR